MVGTSRGGGGGLRSISSFLVDGRGEVHLGQAEQRIVPTADEDNAMTAVKELGGIEWLVRAGHVRVRLRPSMVSPAGYARLQTWLACLQPERVLLSWFARNAWNYEYFQSARDAIDRVEALVEEHGGARACNLRRRACSLQDFREGQVEGAVNFWRDHCKDFRGAESMRALGPLLDDKWLLYKRLPSGGFAVDAFGAHHTDHVRRWLDTHRDEPLHAQGRDSFVSRGCGDVYGSIPDDRAPAAEEIDTVAHWTGFGRLRSRYRRLILPFRAGKRSWVVSGICLDPTIDLLD
jgi:hypothetical protein